MRNNSVMSAKILVVEDNPDARELIVIVLAHAGYEVIEAANGSEALDKAPMHHPDLILMDLGLPGMQGDEVMSRIRSDPRVATIPIVISTAFDRNAEVVKRAIAVGADEILFKPTDLKILLNVARTFTSRNVFQTDHR
jgi:CheY-like chemotaxis protein